MMPLSDVKDVAIAIVLAFFLGGITFLWVYYEWAYHSFRIQSNRTLDGTFAHALMKLVKTHPEVKVALTGDWQCSNHELILEALSFNRFYHGVQSCRTIDDDAWRVKVFYTALLRSRSDPCRSGVLLSTLTDVLASFLNEFSTPSDRGEGEIICFSDPSPSKLKLE